MTDTEQSLLDAVCRDPADDLPRLVYADYLDENGASERAEFIRVQIEIAKQKSGVYLANEANDRVQDELDKRQMALWNFGMPGTWVDTDKPPFDCIQCIDVETISKDKTRDPLIIYCRGFPSAVHCPMSVFLGGPCENCGAGRNVRTLRGHSTNCLACKGAEIIPGLASTLAKRWPVTSVTLVDRDPMEFRYHRSLWRWVNDQYNISFSNINRSALPPDLFAHLKGTILEISCGSEAFYKSRAAAMSALSHAAVDYARDRANIPPLNRVTRPPVGSRVPNRRQVLN